MLHFFAHQVFNDEVRFGFDLGSPTTSFYNVLIADVRERLVFCAQRFIRAEVIDYHPSAADIQFCWNHQRVYPPLDRTLSCLGTLYRCLDVQTFAGLAEDVVQLCVESIQRGSAIVTEQGSVIDGQLFMIEHLLLLREQISPFESEMTDHSISFREVDFSHLRGHLRRLLSGEIGFVSSSPDEFLAFATDSRLRVVEYHIDCRKDIETRLKSACEAYIMSVTRAAVDPMLTFLTKMTAVRMSVSFNCDNPISRAAFATPERLVEIVTKVNNALTTVLPAMIKKMATHLANDVSQRVLLEPIKCNIAEAHCQIATLLESNYEPAFYDRICLKSAAEISSFIDAILAEDV